MSPSTQVTEQCFDTIVIGGGIAGVSIAYELSDRQSVAILEQESTLAYHTTGRSAAMYLQSYGNSPVRALTRASREFFLDPPDGFDIPVWSPMLLLFTAGADAVDALRALHAEIGDSGTTELIDPAVAEELNPLLRPGYTHLAMTDTGAMELDVHALHQGYLRGFRRRHGTVVKSAQLARGHRDRSGWVLRDTAGRTFRAATVVNAAGAWCDEVAQALGARPIDIRPLRRTAFMVPAPPGAPTGLPITMEATEAFYFKPEGAQFLCTPADETRQPPGDAKPDELEIARAIEMLNEATLLGIKTVSSAWAGLRNFTADRTPVVGFAPDCDGLFWYAGQGGYGIQSAPAMARLATALITGESVSDGDLLDGATTAALAPDRVALAHR
ncbi:FAD-dependent oxidoreductase [Nocardia vulneris]|uniref:NAD(P)/FAD-dependent oxidoreductase n=1 Tax=Nocardia vulneris TaxID=1141657 RepID=UPI0030D0C1DA